MQGSKIAGTAATNVGLWEGWKKACRMEQVVSEEERWGALTRGLLVKDARQMFKNVASPQL